MISIQSNGETDTGPADAAKDAWDRVKQVHLDRDADEFTSTIIALKPHTIVDMICFTEKSCRTLVDALVAADPPLPLKQFIHIGSIWSYGPSVSVPTSEDGPHAEPLAEYGREKRLIERYLLPLETPWQNTIFHPGHIVGRGWPPLNPQGNFDPRVFQTLRAGDTLVIPNVGSETVHHIHADDIASAVLAAMESPNAAAGQAFSLVSAQALPLRGFAMQLAQALGWPAPLLECVPCPSAAFDSVVAAGSATLTLEHISHSPCCSNEKLHRLLGLSPRWTSTEAVAEAVTWLEANGELDGSGWYPGKPEGLEK